MSRETDSDTAYDDTIPPVLAEKANNISMNLLPEKSRRQYITAYEEFKKWQKENNSFSR